MITHRYPGMSNLTFLFIWIASIGIIGGMFTIGLLLFSFVLDIALVITYVLSPKLNRILDSDVKLGKYVIYDFRNDPTSYIITSLCLIVSSVWIIKDLITGYGLQFDALLGFYTIYFVISVMILVGYIRDYEDLP